jgi:hypothetical protein
MRMTFTYRPTQRPALPSSCHAQGIGNPVVKDWSLSGRAVE